jgi:hypothetical protein
MGENMGPAATAAPEREPANLPQRPTERAAPVRARAQARPAELSADTLMALGSGERVPANQAERIALINMERRRGEIAAEPYKKGGLVAPKKGATSKMPANKPAGGIASAKTPFKFAKGGASKMKHEDEAMDKKLIRSEMAKAGVGARGGKAAKFARGGGVEIKGKTRGKLA